MLSGLVPHVSKLKYLANENSTTILTGLGVAGTIATAVLTGRASFKAAEIIAKEKRERLDELKFPETEVVERSKTEKAKMVWPQFVPPIVVGAATVSSIILAHKITSKKIAAMTVAVAASDRALGEYKEKVIERLGPKADEKVRDEVAQDRVTANPPRSEEVIMVGSGQVLCYDMLTGRYFNSTVEDIKRAENSVNYELIHFMSCSLSHFYDEIGLPPTAYTDSVGWNMNNRMEVKFSTAMTEDKRPCIAIDFSRPPLSDYTNHWE